MCDERHTTAPTEEQGFTPPDPARRRHRSQPPVRGRDTTALRGPQRPRWIERKARRAGLCRDPTEAAPRFGAMAEERSPPPAGGQRRGQPLAARLLGGGVGGAQAIAGATGLDKAVESVAEEAIVRAIESEAVDRAL